MSLYDFSNSLLERWTVYVYLLCFILYRYNKLHDNLIQSLLHHVKRFSDAAKEDAKERAYNYRVASNRDLLKAAQILQLFTDDHIPESTLFGEVRAKAFGLLTPQQLDLVATHISTRARFDETAFEWEHLEGLAATFKRYLRPTLTASDFVTVSRHDPVMQMVNLLKAAFQKEQLPTKAFVTHHLGKKLRRYLFAPSEPERPIPDRYEYLTYRLLRNGLEAGDICCPDSFRFRSFEDDLVSRKGWQDKDQLLAEIGLPRLKQSIKEHLHELKKRLEQRLEEVNGRIARGENEHFSARKGGRWSLAYQGRPESLNHPFYDQLEQTDVSLVLHFVDERCPFIHTFDHILGRYTKSTLDLSTLVACLIAWGTNLGLGKMSEVSDLSYAVLRTSILGPKDLSASRP